MTPGAGAGAALACPECGDAVDAGDRFCEACGAGLPAVAVGPTSEAADACAVCGDPGPFVDGYCPKCGFKQPPPHDHEEVDLGVLAGVTDRGLRHPCNQDAMSIEIVGRSLIAVVCDGVSSAVAADIAAQAAADAARAVLARAAEEDPESIDGALAAAVEAAQSAVLAVPFQTTDGFDAPSCTFLAAVARDGTVKLAWLGDCRAYWFGAGGCARLTVDDSWAADMVATGAMSEAAAEADERAHSITRWLGPDAPTLVPQTTTLPVAGPGMLLLCSDGLWNYASAPDALAAVVDNLPAERAPLAVARRLTDFARDAGGHDNITAVVASLSTPSRKDTPS